MVPCAVPHTRAIPRIVASAVLAVVACGTGEAGPGASVEAGGSGTGGGRAGAAGSAAHPGGSGGNGGVAAGAKGGASGAGSGGGAGNGGSAGSPVAGAGGATGGGGAAGFPGGAAGAGAMAGASRGPAYDAGTASCPPADGTRRVKLVNNCTAPRWFKLDGRTTPTWARPSTCPWAGESCSDLDGVGQCTAIAKAKSPGVDPGLVYCKATGAGSAGVCACNPHFSLEPGAAHEIVLPAGAAFPSGTGWLATGCNALGASCALGNDAANNSVYEFTYDKPGGSLYYDLSAVNAWTSVSSVGMKSCGGALDPKDEFRCAGTGCRFEVTTQCPDGSPAFAGAPSGCITCPVKTVGGKQVLDGPCGPCPDGASANRVPSGTVFNAGNVGGPEWTWTGAPDFATTFGFDEGAHANRRRVCTAGVCKVVAAGQSANTCLGGCDLCTLSTGTPPDGPECLKYCCPDVTRAYGGASYRYDSAGCTALGVQRGTDYTATLKAACPHVYTYGYEDHSSTFICDTSASLVVQACPDPVDYPAAASP